MRLHWFKTLTVTMYVCCYTILFAHIHNDSSVAEHATQKIIVEELLNRLRLEKLLRDSYGNYCVQVRRTPYYLCFSLTFHSDCT